MDAISAMRAVRATAQSQLHRLSFNSIGRVASRIHRREHDDETARSDGWDWVENDGACALTGGVDSKKPNNVTRAAIVAALLRRHPAGANICCGHQLSAKQPGFEATGIGPLGKGS